MSKNIDVLSPNLFLNDYSFMNAFLNINPEYLYSFVSILFVIMSDISELTF